MIVIIQSILLFSCAKKSKEEDKLLAGRLVNILSYKEMADITPSNLFIFETNGIILQRSAEHPYWWSYVDENNSFQTEVKFQKDDADNWEYLKTTISMKGKGKSFFQILLSTMEQAAGTKGIETHWGKTENYTWQITPELNASINGYQKTGREIVIKMEVGYTQVEEADF